MELEKSYFIFALTIVWRCGGYGLKNRRVKNRRVNLSFQCRNEFYMPKYPNNRIFMGFGEKS